MKNLLPNTTFPRLISISVLAIALVQFAYPVQAIAPQTFAGKPKICQGFQPAEVVKCTIAHQPHDLSHPTNRPLSTT